MLREELQLLQEPGSYVGEVVKVMSKTKVLVKARRPCAAAARSEARIWRACAPALARRVRWRRPPALRDVRCASSGVP